MSHWFLQQGQNRNKKICTQISHNSVTSPVTVMHWSKVCCALKTSFQF